MKRQVGTRNCPHMVVKDVFEFVDFSVLKARELNLQSIKYISRIGGLRYIDSECKAKKKKMPGMGVER